MQISNPSVEAHREWKLRQECDVKPISKGEAYRQILAELFARYTSFGTYPVVAIDEKSNVLCVDCARNVFLEEREDIYLDVYWEGPPMECAECNEEIESAYGDPYEGQ